MHTDQLVLFSLGICKEPFRLFPTGSRMDRVQTYILPNARSVCSWYNIIFCTILTISVSGRIHHIQETSRGNGDADEIFKEYQEHALTGTLEFRRWPMRAASFQCHSFISRGTHMNNISTSVCSNMFLLTPRDIITRQRSPSD